MMRSIRVTERLTAVLISLGCLLIVLLALAMLPATARASFCSSHEDKLQEAPVIFSGKVLNITRDQYDDEVVRLDVSKIWRGTVQAQAVVRTGDGISRDCGRGDCGYKFKVNNSYLVFAYERPAPLGLDMTGSEPTVLMTDLCSRTSVLSAAQQDLASLGAGRLPPTGSSSGEGSNHLWSYLVAAFGFIAAGLGLRSLADALKCSRVR